MREKSERAVYLLWEAVEFDWLLLCSGTTLFREREQHQANRTNWQSLLQIAPPIPFFDQVFKIHAATINSVKPPALPTRRISVACARWKVATSSPRPTWEAYASEIHLTFFDSELWRPRVFTTLLCFAGNGRFMLNSPKTHFCLIGLNSRMP